MRNHKLDTLRTPLRGEKMHAVINRLKTAGGHIDHIVGMVEDEAFAIDILRQLAAVRGALDATTRVVLRHYFENGFTNAVRAGQSEAAIDEMTRALKFLRELE